MKGEWIIAITAKRGTDYIVMIIFIRSISLRITLLASLVVLITDATFISRLESKNKNFESSETVRINILSKHIRLLREGKYQRIGFSFSRALMEEVGAGTVDEIENLYISCEKGVLRLSTGKKEFSDSFHLRISSRWGSAACRVHLPGDLRSYPLPVAFRMSHGELDITVTESLSRYIADSAVAEYGRLPSKYSEAIRALSIVIAGRYYFNKRKPHRNSDFCDLTHCQVYRGRISDEDFYGKFPDWLIDVRGLPVQLFFHSRCAGMTFDSRIFGYERKVHRGIRDWISDRGMFLCRDKGALWENSISARELTSILFKKSLDAFKRITINYDREKLRIMLRGKNVHREYPPEDFRLRINRVRGWNFIKSNNYHITSMNIGDEKIFKFTGSGLGHGVGFCQHGALSLAQMGYSRYEIIEHYFPDINLIRRSRALSSPYLSYLIFSMKTGKIERGGYRRFLYRMMPPGSIFKILVSLYIARERRDLVKDYRYLCRGRSNDKNLPKRCWNPDGHGINNLSSALSISCNLYFASLYRHIRYSSFKKFTENFFKIIDIRAELPDIESGKEFSKLLSGLDFRMRLSVKDLMKIVRFISPIYIDNHRIDMAKRLYAAETDIIHTALIDTIEKGTASGDLKPYGSELSYRPLLENYEKRDVPGRDGIDGKMWGKTSTVIEGTNSRHSYGIFIGGDDERGVVVVLRKGNGHIAAKWGILLLHEMER
jgi:SpoIID/LytB domain protein